MKKPPAQVLRLNQLRRRADALGVDVYLVVKWDAVTQREPPLEPDQEQNKIAPRQLSDGA